jgi:hypothetical protein
MLRRELHNRGSAGRCAVCGEIFPCPTSLAIYEAVKRELEHPTPPPAAAPPPPALPTEQRPPYAPTWEELPDREYRCPVCLHWWTNHGLEPGGEGCQMMESSMAERSAMAEHDRELQRQGMPPEASGPMAYRDLRYCGCRERPKPGSTIAVNLEREAAYQAKRPLKNNFLS